MDPLPSQPSAPKIPTPPTPAPKPIVPQQKTGIVPPNLPGTSSTKVPIGVPNYSASASPVQHKAFPKAQPIPMMEVMPTAEEAKKAGGGIAFVPKTPEPKPVAPVMPTEPIAPIAEPATPAPITAPTQKTTPSPATSNLKRDISSMLNDIDPVPPLRPAGEKKDTYREAPEVEKNNFIPTKIAPIPEKKVAPPPVPHIPTSMSATGLQRLRTYEGDVADAIKNQNTSVVKIALAEQKKKGVDGLSNETSDDIVRRNKRNKTALIVSVGLLFGGTIALAVVYYFLYYRIPPAVIPTQTELIIISDVEKEISVSSVGVAGLLDTLIDAENATIPAGSIEHIFFTNTVATQKKTVSASEFFELFSIRAPSAFVRALDTNFLFGIHNNSTSEPFIILTPKSFETVFAGMLEWEPTLYKDIQKIFLVGQAIQAGASSTPQSTFTDVVIQNNDTRMLRDQSGKPVLIYSFPDKKHLIITTNEATLRELLIRLTTSSKIKR